jgi:hypothetical protein
LTNLKWSLESNIADSVTNISPHKPLIVDAATDVIYDYPIVHLEKLLADCLLAIN